MSIMKSFIFTISWIFLLTIIFSTLSVGISLLFGWLFTISFGIFTLFEATLLFLLSILVFLLIGIFTVFRNPDENRAEEEEEDYEDYRMDMDEITERLSERIEDIEEMLKSLKTPPTRRRK